MLIALEEASTRVALCTVKDIIHFGILIIEVISIDSKLAVHLNFLVLKGRVSAVT